MTRNKHYRDILSRTSDSTGLDKEFLDIVCKCFLYEIAEELVKRTIELPYIGDLSLRNKKLDPNKFLKTLKHKGGSNASKFKQKHAETLDRNRIERKRSSGSSSGSGIDGGIHSNTESSDTDILS